jgi:plastocyanin
MADNRSPAHRRHEADMRRFFAIAAILGATIVFCGPSLTQQTPHHEFAVAARRYAFEPATLEVHQGDLIRITLRTEDIPHSFVIDALRVARRVTPDHAVTLEMFADQAGVFPFYCNLTLEAGCRDMRGRLMVRPETGVDGRSGWGLRAADPALGIRGCRRQRPRIPASESRRVTLLAASPRHGIETAAARSSDGAGIARNVAARPRPGACIKLRSGSR